MATGIILGLLLFFVIESDRLMHIHKRSEK